MNRQQIVTLALFGACYAYLCVGRKWKAPVVWAFAAVFVALGAINWNVIGTFAGTFVAAQLFASSGVPLLLARGIVSRSRNVGTAVVLVCVRRSSSSRPSPLPWRSILRSTPPRF